MSADSYAVRDSMTMLRRNLKHARRYPSMTISVIAMPLLMLLLFVYVFGGALGGGIDIPGATGGGDRGDYTNYVTPGILLMAVTSAAISTAVSVCSDMTEGIINRFRTMAISRSSVLVGHVVGNVIRTLISLSLVIVVALAVGFRPDAGAVEWLAALGILVALAFALAWISAAMGLGSQSVETASNAPMPLTFLPFLGSAVVTPDTMPDGLRWFAEYQPFTPINETLRGLLLGTEIGNDAWISLAWLLGLSAVGYFWAKASFARTVKR
ncbi:ABC transporter permease [Streptomyces aureocirculatus]|uniref:ABC transporter permease n=1 Tax=Streptomyces aureocirculatus TaxID=67275 RepID=UPI0004CB9593|nr:ABC transporter permease [Streptomyces aureocirculatus]